MEPNKLFCYGILKRGFAMDLERYGAKFIGSALLEGAQLYHIGRGVGLRPVESGEQDALPSAHGEVFEVPDDMWPWIDRLESNGFAYTRKIYTPIVEVEGGRTLLDAWVYVHTYPGMKYDKPIVNNLFAKEEWW